MIVRITDILILTAAVPLAASIGVLVAQTMGNRHWAKRFVAIEMISGVVGGILLAVLLWPREAAPVSATVILWDWFSLSTPQSLAVSIGLEASAMKSCLVASAGLLALVLLWKGDLNKLQPLSDDCILSAAALYVSGIVFVCSPSLPQSLLGWAAISLFTIILFRLSKQKNAESIFVKTSTSTIHRSDSPALRIIVAVIHGIEWLMLTVRDKLTVTFPNWLLEHVDLIDRGPVSIQLLAATLGTSAVLLTWLLLSFHTGSYF